MAYGLRVKRASTGGYQIDPSYSNQALSACGHGVTNVNQSTTSGKESSYLTVSLPASRRNPVIALAGTSGKGCVMIQQTSSVFTVFCSGLAGQTFDWYVFDDVDVCPAPTGHYGLIVRDPSTGQVRFDSRMKYLNVVGNEFTYPSTFLTSSATGGLFSGTAGRTYAGIQICAGVRQYRDTTAGGEGTTPCTTWSAGLNRSGSSIYTQGFAVYGFPGSPSTDTIGTTGRWLPIDVTGFM